MCKAVQFPVQSGCLPTPWGGIVESEFPCDEEGQRKRGHLVQQRRDLRMLRGRRGRDRFCEGGHKCAASQHICARNDHIDVMMRRRKGATTSLGGNIGQMRNVNEIACIAQIQNSEGVGKKDGTCNVKKRYERGNTPEGRPRETATQHRPVWRVWTADMKTISNQCL